MQESKIQPEDVKMYASIMDADTARVAEVPQNEVVSNLFTMIDDVNAKLANPNLTELDNRKLLDRKKQLAQKILNILSKTQVDHENQSILLDQSQLDKLKESLGSLSETQVEVLVQQLRPTVDFPVFDNVSTNQGEGEASAYETEFINKVVAKIEQDYPQLNKLVFFMGGAAEFAQDENFQQLFTDLVSRLSQPPGESFFGHGGTKSGIMELVGRAVGQVLIENPKLRMVNMGIFPADCVVGYDNPSAQYDKYPPAPNMTHLLPVQGTPEQIGAYGGWGCETRLMYKIFNALASKNQRQSVGVLANGGGITLHELRENLLMKRKVVVVEGTGRSADLLAWVKQDQTRLHYSQDDFNGFVQTLAEDKQAGFKKLFPLLTQFRNILADLEKTGVSNSEVFDLFEVVPTDQVVERVVALVNQPPMQKEVEQELEQTPVPA